MANPSGPRVSLERRWFPQRDSAAESPAEPEAPGHPGALCLVVLGRSADLAHLLEKALWTWPHRIRYVSRTSAAIAILDGGMPTALLVSADDAAARTGRGLRRLRDRFPALPIVVLGSATDRPVARRFVACGASAFLDRDRLGRGRLHDLLTSLAATLHAGGDALVHGAPQLDRHYRDSEHIGALLVNAGATILDANPLLLEWFGIARADALRGRNLCWAFGVARERWQGWRRRIERGSGMVRDTVEFVSVAGVRRAVDLELFQAGDDSSVLQLNCFARRE